MTLEKSLDRGKAIETKSEVREKKSYLRQLCERLCLDPAKNYSKEAIDQLEPSDRKRKFLVEMIDYYEKSRKSKSDKAFNNRCKEIISINVYKNEFIPSWHKYKLDLRNLSYKIYSIEYMIIEKTKNTQMLRLASRSSNELQDPLLSPFISDLKESVKKRQRLVQEYQKKLQERIVAHTRRVTLSRL